MKRLNSQKGITLIALVVTIVVLIIIAGISIATLTADNGVLRQTNLAKVENIEGTAREQVKLAMSAMRLAIAEAQALDNSYKASDNRDKIKDVLLSTIQADTTALEKDSWSAANDTAANVFKITYAGDDYKQACNDDNAEIVYTITLGQKSIEITNETNATLKDQNGNDVNLDIGGSTGNGSGNGSGEGSGGGTQEPVALAAGLYETGSNYTKLLKSWDDLLSEGVVHVENGVVYTNVITDTWENASSDALTGDLMLPNDGSVTSIGEAAFYNCTNLASVTIPDSVTSIDAGAFCECRSLTNIIIPDSVTSIGESAFGVCTSLTSVIIPDGVTSIGSGAFYECKNLTSITIPDSVTSIGEAAFFVCTSLTSVIIPDSVTSIGAELFYKCTSLTSVTIPDGVTSIDAAAFCDCENLANVTIPDSVTSIGDNAFNGCTNLTNITFAGTINQWNTIDKGYLWKRRRSC